MHAQEISFDTKYQLSNFFVFNEFTTIQLPNTLLFNPGFEPR